MLKNYMLVIYLDHSFKFPFLFLLSFFLLSLGNIAKRWKEKKIEKHEEEKLWEEKDTAELAIAPQVAAVVELPVSKAAIALATTNSGGKKKRNISNNNRYFG